MTTPRADKVTMLLDDERTDEEAPPNFGPVPRNRAVSCVTCKCDVSSGHFVKILPCSHEMCSKCALSLFSGAFARRPVCNSPIQSHVYYSPSIHDLSTLDLLLESSPVI
jgi:hypothetical protein